MKPIYRFAIAAIIIIILSLGLIFTPAGKALADEIVRFFNPAAGTSFPLPPEEVFPLLPTDTPEPTHAAQLLPAEQIKPVTSQATSTPFLNLSAEQMQNLDSITAQDLVDFPIQAPGYLPEGYRLDRIFYDDKNRTVNMEYTSSKPVEEPTLHIAQGKPLMQDLAGASLSSEDIQINGTTARLMRGSWEVSPGGGRPLWQDYPDDITILWQAEDITVSVQVQQNAASNANSISREELIKTAESVSHCQEQDYVCNVRQAGIAAGFTPWQFPQAPEGLSFKNTYYLPTQTAIWYGGIDGELGILQSRNNFSSQEESEWFSVPQDSIQKVIVAGQPAEYVNGSFFNKAGEDHATWNPDSGQIRLRWKNGDYWFQIVKWGAPEMEPQELADLAGTLTNDPNRVDSKEQEKAAPMMGDVVYNSIAEIRDAAKFKILTPAILPDGLPFSHARLTSPQSAMLFYGDFAADKMHTNGPCLIVIISQADVTSAAPEDFYALYPAKAIEDVQVAGQPAKLLHGTIMTYGTEKGQPTKQPEWTDPDGILTLSWKTEDGEFTIQFNPTPASGMRLDKADLIKIGESLQ